jgi:hypothetical protein
MAGIDPATGTIPEGIEAQTERGLLVSIEAIAVVPDVSP